MIYFKFSKSKKVYGPFKDEEAMYSYLYDKFPNDPRIVYFSTKKEDL